MHAIGNTKDGNGKPNDVLHILFMKAKIEKYLPDYNCHQVTDEKKRVRMMDVMVAGNLPEDIDPESLVGKTIYYDYEHPWIAIAQGVSIIQSNNQEKETK